MPLGVVGPGDLADICGYCGIKLLVDDVEALEPSRDMCCDAPEAEACLPASPVPASKRVTVGTTFEVEDVELDALRPPI